MDLIFVNPAAGNGQALAAARELQAYATRTGWKADFRLTTSAKELSELARAAAAGGQERIFVLGGDGSFQDLVNALVGFPNVVLGILPAGSGNDLAQALGLPNDPLRAAELLRTAEVLCMDAVRVKTSDGAVRLFTGGGGVGLDAEASHLAATRYRHLAGRTRYLVSAARAFRSFRSPQVHLKMDLAGGQQQQLSARALLVGILNTPSYGAGLRFAPQAKIDDGILDLVLLQDLPLGEILWALPRVITSGEVRSRRVKRFAILRATIETDSPCRFHGDGELLGYTPVEIEIVPQAIRVLRPSTSAANS